MSENLVFPVSEATLERTRCTLEAYQEKYRRSVEDPEGFWLEEGKRIDWIKPFTKVREAGFDGDVSIKWFEDGTLNACYNCIDRHLPGRAGQIALIWEGDDPNESSSVTYQQLFDHVCRFANVLKARGVKKGDRVTIYMPMILETVYAMLACARIGAVHSVVFGGFSPDSIAGRITDCRSTTVITADEGVRGGKRIPLKGNVDEALQSCPDVHTVIVVKRTGGEINWQEGRDVWYHELAGDVLPHCEPEEM
ncbi:MAG: AMP-binding protein, partial [Sphingomonadales bacterium]